MWLLHWAPRQYPRLAHLSGRRLLPRGRLPQHPGGGPGPCLCHLSKPPPPGGSSEARMHLLAGLPPSPQPTPRRTAWADARPAPVPSLSPFSTFEMPRAFQLG